jgi:DNA-binding response OmpR family regulator
MSAAAVQMKVLIVEDDASTCEVFTRLLQRHGIAFDCAKTVGEALLKLEEYNAPSAMILDINLPDASGSVLLRRIRRDNLPIKVAIVTGIADPTRYGDLLEIPPDVILAKPVNLGQLIQWVEAK